MYQAKDRGRDRIELFDGAMRSEAAARLPAETALKRALDNGEITVHYQPIVSLHAGPALVGLESAGPLDRRHGPDPCPEPVHRDRRGNRAHSPARRKRCSVRPAARSGELNRSFPDRPPSQRLGEPVGPRELETPGLTATVESMLSSSGLDPGDLWLEITETLLMEERETCLSALNALSELGSHVGGGRLRDRVLLTAVPPPACR